MAQNFDVVVVGGGPGGYVAAIRAAQLGFSTACVEAKHLGGICLNWGCIPTKSLLRNAEIWETLQHADEYGVSFDNLSFDFSKIIARSRGIADKMSKGVAFLFKKYNVTHIPAWGKLLGGTTVGLFDKDGGKTDEIHAKHVILATGARPRSIPGITIDRKRVISYFEAMSLPERPQSLIVLGAGAIGVEFATVWNAYGSQITMVEMLPAILPLQDAEISAELDKQYRRRKIKTLTGHRVLSVKKTDTGVEVVVSDGSEEKTLTADQALVAIGFRPNSANLGLEALGVELDKRGYIAIDDKMATNVPGIYAIGDVTGKLLLAHTASAQAMICAEAMAGQETHALDYKMIPSAVFSHPQVASFGWTEADAAKEGIEVKVGRFPFLPNGKALGLGENVGFVKIIAEAASGRIIGAHMIGPDVSELLPELTLAANQGLTAAEIGQNVHTHPTLSEVLMEAAHALEGHAIHI